MLSFFAENPMMFKSISSAIILIIGPLHALENKFFFPIHAHPPVFERQQYRALPHVLDITSALPPVWMMTAGRIGFSLLIEPPFDALITFVQAEKAGQPLRKSLPELWRQHGVASLFKGAPIKMRSIIYRSVWTWGFYDAFPGFYASICAALGESVAQNRLTEKMWTGLAWGAINAAIDTPLERRRMRAVLDLSNDYTKPLWTAQVQHYYRGFLPTFLMGSLSCGLFLTQEQFLRTLFIPDPAQTRWSDHVKTGAILGSTYVALTHPLFFLRTTMQMAPYHQGIKLRDAVKTAWQLGGRHFYAGWQLRLVRSVMLSTLDTFMLHHLEQHQKSSSTPGTLGLASLE